MARTGRPRLLTKKKIEHLKRLMRSYPSEIDACYIMECGVTTLRDTIRKYFNMTFREFRDYYMSHTRLALKQKAIKMAMDAKDPNIKMLDRCLTNICKWNDSKVNADIDMKNKVTIKEDSLKKIVSNKDKEQLILEIAEDLAKNNDK